MGSEQLGGEAFAAQQRFGAVAPGRDERAFPAAEVEPDGDAVAVRTPPRGGDCATGRPGCSPLVRHNGVRTEGMYADAESGDELGEVDRLVGEQIRVDDRVAPKNRHRPPHLLVTIEGNRRDRNTFPHVERQGIPRP